MTDATRIEAKFYLPRRDFLLDVQFTLPAQGICAIFGVSGSGKSTLLRCIAGLERVPGGYCKIQQHVWQDGKIWLPAWRRPIGYVFQEASLFSHLTVEQNLQYGLRRIPTQQRGDVSRMTQMLDIEHLLPRKPQKLSGGERQRVGIARALVMQPQLLLMDEPLSALDDARKQEILPYLERLRDEMSIPILYVTHSQHEVMRLADHLLLLEQGRILLNKPLPEALGQPGSPFSSYQDASTLLHTHVAEINTTWQLARMAFHDGSLWLRNENLIIGQAVRLEVLARDASLVREHPQHTSIQNILPATITRIDNGNHPALALVTVHVGTTRFLVQISHRAAHDLQLTPGQNWWLQIKTAALLR